MNIPELWRPTRIGNIATLTGTAEALKTAGLQASSATMTPRGLVLTTGQATALITIGQKPIATDQSVINLDCNHDLANERFLSYLLPYMATDLELLLNGSSILRLSLSFLTIPLPPISEQRYIASILIAAEAIRERQQIADEKARIMLVRLFEQTFLLHQSAKDWPVITVGEAGEVQLGRQRSPQYKTGRYTKPYLRVANVLEDEIDFSDILEMDFDRDDLKRYRLEFGDILLNEGQSTELIGRPAMWREEEIPSGLRDRLDECCYQNHLIRFRADRTRCLPEYALGLFLHYFHTGEFSRLSTKTSNIATLGSRRFVALPFPLPPLELQEAYARQVVAVRETLRKIRAARAKTLDILEKLSALAFTGTLSARWREANQEMLHREAAERDRYLNAATVAKNGVSAEHLPDEIEASTIPDLRNIDLLQPLHSRPGFWQDVSTDSSLRTVYTLLRGAPGGFGTLDTIHDLLSEQEEPEFTEDEIKRALEVLAAAGILLQLTIEVPDPSNPDTTICFDAYRLLSEEDAFDSDSSIIDEQRNTHESENRFPDTTSIGIAR